MNEAEVKPDYKLERWITLILALLFLLPFVARAQEPEPELPAPVNLSEVDHGSLLLKTSQPGLYIPAPTLSTRVEMRVSGMILRARVIQQFQNPASRCVEAIYVFPLPEDAAVDQLHMIIGDRRIEGQIKEKEEARRTYEQARSEGRKASLLEQQRPNVFTVSVSSLLPDEIAQIEIQYQQIVDYRDGRFSLRFPMLVAPRYTPNSGGGALASLVPEHFPRFEAMLSPDNYANPVDLRIELDAGFPLKEIQSTYNVVRTTALGPNQYEVVLADGATPANRDFELVWQPEIGREPKAAVFSETINGDSYALVMVLPPTDQVTPIRLPRESIYVIDTSGSMEGASMQQAREGLILALRGLDPGDTFNVVEFDSDVQMLFDQSRPADPSTVADAIRWVEKLEADDGTEMLLALQAALPSSSVSDGRLRQVIFMTDGQVSNEAQLFDYIHGNLGRSRLFTVGIGSTPNSHFMRRAAQLGRGTFTYIGDLAEVKTKMEDLFRKIDNPVLSDIQLRFEQAVSEAYPSRIPDLYVGEPLMIAVKVAIGQGSVAVQGKTGSSAWNETLSLAGGSTEAGIGKLWARRKIESLDDSVTAGADPQQVRGQIVETALQHHLVSQHTSLVAVDVTPTGLDWSRCSSQLLPLNQPKGWREDGMLPSTATPAPLMLLLGFALVSLGLVAWRLSS